MEKRQRVVVMPFGSEYRVVGLTNRLEPAIETLLHPTDLKELISMKHLDVEIIREEE